MEKEKVTNNEISIEKIHRILNHKEVKNMEYVFRIAGKINPTTVKLIEEVVEECEICR